MLDDHEAMSGCGDRACVDCARARVDLRICAAARRLSNTIGLQFDLAKRRIEKALDEVEKSLPPPVAAVKHHFGHRFRYLPDDGVSVQMWETMCYDCGCHYCIAHVATCGEQER